MKVNVVTGGGSGIGFEVSKEFSKDELVIISGRKEDKLQKAVEKLKEFGVNADYKTSDVSKKDSVDELLKYAKSKGDLKSVVNCAGVSGDTKNIELIYNIDLVGSKIVMDSVYDYAEKGTALILIASMMGHVVPDNKEYNEALAYPDKDGSEEIFMKFVNGDGAAAYNFSKKGAMLMAKANAERFGEKGARIVTVSPGIVMTAMAREAQSEHPEVMKFMEDATPLKRVGEPQDIARAVVFLASEKADFITGTDVLVDGGLSLNLDKLKQLKK